ncbi:maestro heat-like repeat-containing protein family member 1 [Dermochelys coriacea]|uniref:maestro heat-like repeat-containing protein family member 1 n=1 Tax=Dermochelys coriacea TaxID=27794 RepID=UPI001CA7BAC7|nr:maestro heat-like repeat-containing protein family member 1 [Dermochelys coriacea]
MAAGLWMKIILKECGDATLDKVPDILAILYRHMPTIREGSLRQFLAEAVSFLDHHHREAVISSLLSKHLPMDRLSIKALESVLFKSGNERLVRTLRKQRTWILLENPKSHHEGVCLLVSLLLRSGLRTPEIIQSLLPWVNSPTENHRVTSTAFLAQECRATFHFCAPFLGLKRLQTAINEHLDGTAALKPEELQVDICRHLAKENVELLENLYKITITYFCSSWEEIWAVAAKLAGIILEHTDTQRMKWLDLEHLLMSLQVLEKNPSPSVQLVATEIISDICPGRVLGE